MAKEKKRKHPIREWTEAILVALVLALFIRTFLIQAFKIPSGSMLETLQIGDHLLVNKCAYDVKLPKIFAGDTSGGLFSMLFDTAGGPVLLTIGDPERGDVIVFEYPEDPSKDFIKRVIGLPGETVEVRNKQILVNDQPLDEDYVQYLDPDLVYGPRDNWGPRVVPEDSFFVMGDNRDHSRDSRFWGYVPRDAIVGKALFLYWSWDNEAFRPRWGRVLDAIE